MALIRSLTVIAGAGLLALGTASSASALNPPIADEFITQAGTAGELIVANAMTGTTTALNAPDMPGVAAFDIGPDGNGFAVSGGAPAVLFAITSTGGATMVNALNSGGDDPLEYPSCTGLDYTNGVLLVVCSTTDGTGTFVGAVEGPSAVVVPIVESDTAGWVEVARDPASSAVYLISAPSGGTGSVLSRLDLESATVESLGELTAGGLGANVVGADFDAFGTLFVVEQVDGETSRIASVDLTTRTLDFGSFLVDGNDDTLLAQPLTVLSSERLGEEPPRTLPATGPSPLTLAAVAVGLLVLGAAAASRRRTRPTR